jgi:hypothetical protein
MRLAAASDVVVARQLIWPQALVGRTRIPQPHARTLPTVSIKEDHTLVLESDPDGRHSSFGRAKITIRFSPLDDRDGQARASCKLGLGQSEKRPSGPQLSGCNQSLVHQDLLLQRCGRAPRIASSGPAHQHARKLNPLRPQNKAELDRLQIHSSVGLESIPGTGGAKLIG